MKLQIFTPTFFTLSALMLGNSFFIILFSSTKAPFHFSFALLIYLVVFCASLVIYLKKITQETLRKKMLYLLALIFPNSIALYTVQFLFEGKILLNDLVITTGFLIIPLSLFLCAHFLYVTLPPLQKSAEKTAPSPRKTWLLYVVFFLFVGLYGVSEQSLVDEPLWIFDRVERYFVNIFEIDFYNTRPSDKPGVPVSIASSISLLKYHSPSALVDTITPDVRQDLLLWMRVPIVIIVAILLIPLFWVVRKLFNSQTAHFTMLFIVMSPLLVGMTRIINPDAFLWILMPLTMLFFVLSFKTKSRKYTLIAGMIFGTTLLTKYVANVFFVFFPIMIIVAAIFFKAKNADKDMTVFLQERFHVFALFVVTTILTIIAVLPSIWVFPYHLLQTTILSQAFAPIWMPFLIVITLIYVDIFVYKFAFLEKIVTFLAKYEKVLRYGVSMIFLGLSIFVLATAFTHTSFDYQNALTSPKSALKNVGHMTTFFSGFYVLLFGTHALILLGALFGIYKMHHAQNTFAKTLLYSTLLFIPFYYLGAMFGDVASTLRYQIALYPLLFIIAAYGYAHVPTTKNSTLNLFLYLSFATILFFSLLAIKPFYFSYNNAILPQGDILNIKDMGDGSFQAAAYLNALPNAHALTIWADKAGVCAAFIGHCETFVSLKKIEEQNIHFDYFVISRTKEFLMTRKANRELRREYVPQNPLIFADLYDTDTPFEHEIIVGTRDYNHIRIINASNIDITDENFHDQK